MATPPEWTTLEELSRMAETPEQALFLSEFRKSPLLDHFRSRNVPGASVSFQRQKVLPTAQRRGLNEDFVATRGSSGVDHESLRIYGLRIKNDRAAQRMQLTNMGRQLAAGLRAVRLEVEKDIIYGDPSTNELQATGLQYHAENSEDPTMTSVSAGATSGGAALSTRFVMDRVDDLNGEGEPVIICSMAMANLFRADTRSTIVYDNDREASRSRALRAFWWNDIRIVVAEKDRDQVRLLRFNEAAATGSPTATSIYLVMHGRGGYYPFQNGPLETISLAPTGSQLPVEVEYLFNTAVETHASVIRIKHIGNLDLVA